MRCCGLDGRIYRSSGGRCHVTGRVLSLTRTISVFLRYRLSEFLSFAKVRGMPTVRQIPRNVALFARARGLGRLSRTLCFIMHQKDPSTLENKETLGAL